MSADPDPQPCLEHLFFVPQNSATYHIDFPASVKCRKRLAATGTCLIDLLNKYGTINVQRRLPIDLGMYCPIVGYLDIQ